MVNKKSVVNADFGTVLYDYQEDHNFGRNVSKIDDNTNLFDVVGGAIASINFNNYVIEDVEVGDYSFKNTIKALKLRKSSRLVKSLTASANKLCEEQNEVAVYKKAINVQQNTRNKSRRFASEMVDYVHGTMVNNFGEDTNFISVNARNNPLGCGAYAPKGAALTYDGESKMIVLAFKKTPLPQIKSWLQHNGFTRIGTYQLWVAKGVAATNADFLKIARKLSKCIIDAHTEDMAESEEIIESAPIHR